jgi:hypothetical protein
MIIEFDPSAKLIAAIAEYLNSGGTFERGLFLLRATAYLHTKDTPTTRQAATKTGKKRKSK